MNSKQSKKLRKMANMLYNSLPDDKKQPINIIYDQLKQVHKKNKNAKK